MQGYLTHEGSPIHSGLLSWPASCEDAAQNLEALEDPGEYRSTWHLIIPYKYITLEWSRLSTITIQERGEKVKSGVSECVSE